MPRWEVFPGAGEIGYSASGILVISGGGYRGTTGDSGGIYKSLREVQGREHIPALPELFRAVASVHPERSLALALRGGGHGLAMPTTPKQIDLWRQSLSEHQRLEFKEAKTQFDNNKLYKYCVALANEGGGFLVLGISDKPPRPVVGTQALSDTVSMAEKLFQAVGFRVDIEEVRHPDGRVLVFHIPSRPRGTAYRLDGAYLMRSGQSLRPMSEDQLRRIFSKGEPDWGGEPARTGLDAQQILELLGHTDLLRTARVAVSAGAPRCN